MSKASELEKNAMFQELQKFLEDELTKFASDDEVKEISTKIEEMERKFIESLSKLDNGSDQVPIINGVNWRSEKQAHDFCKVLHATLLDKKDVMKDLSEGVDTEGGFLVAPDFRSTLIRLMETFGTVRNRSTVIPMRSNALELPKLTSGITVYWPDESATITESQPAFGNVTLTAKKLAALVPVTGELLEDSSIAIANLISSLFAEAFAEEEDRVSLTGDRTGAGDPFNGILYASGVGETYQGGSSTSTQTSINDMTADDLLNLTDNIPTPALAGSVFVMHRTVLNVARKLKSEFAQGGDYIFQAPTAVAPGTIWGWPYVLSDVMPSINDDAVDLPHVIFGNFRHYYIGDRRRMTVASSQHVGFKEDRVFIRALQRIAFRIAIPAAFARLRTAAS